MSLVAIRAHKWLTRDELTAHLALLLRLEHVGALLGSGASVYAGGSTMLGLWKDFLVKDVDSIHANLLVKEGFISDEDRHLANFQTDTPGFAPNVERLLDRLEVAEVDWARRRPTSRNLKKLKNTTESLLRAVLRAALLKDGLWTEPGSRPHELTDHLRLLHGLLGARQPGQPSPWVFTTNYDLAVEFAAESAGIHVHNGFVGVHDRRFSPQAFDIGLRNVHAKGEARFGAMDVYLAKLHGSLTWRRTEELFFRELAATEAWSSLKGIAIGEGEVDRDIMVFPRASKYMQTVGYLLGELFRRFSDFLAQPQTFLLVTGYSFGDEHLNRLVMSALLNPTLQLVAVFPDLAKGKGDQPDWRSNKFIEALLALRSPRVTIVGGGSAAHFDKVVELLPDPILYDLKHQELLDKLRKRPDDDQNR